MKKGKVDVVVGLSLGDEGKGRFVDILADTDQYKYIARFNGGNNAGHTLISPSKRKLILNLIPSGVFKPETVNYVGSGCVVDPVNLVQKEIPSVQKEVDLHERLKVSAFATAITPLHIFWDKVTGAKIGTTGKGIGPAYADKMTRTDGVFVTNFRLAEVLANPKEVKSTLEDRFEMMMKICLLDEYFPLFKMFAEKNGLDVTKDKLLLIDEFKSKYKISEQIQVFLDSVKKLAELNFIEFDKLKLNKELAAGKSVLAEGAQAYGLDISYSPVPYSTSSNTISGNAFVGGDMSPAFLGKVYGVYKIIDSRVGMGRLIGEFGGNRSEIYCDEKNADGSPKFSRDFEAENYDFEQFIKSNDDFEVGVALRHFTGEYGATTGRPRRLRVPNLVALTEAIAANGVTDLFITKFDCLHLYSQMTLFNGKLPVIDSYNLNGRILDYTPATNSEIEQISPNYSFLDIPEKIDSSEKNLVNFPNANALVEYINKKCLAVVGGDFRIAGVGVGPGRDEVIYL